MDRLFAHLDAEEFQASGGANERRRFDALAAEVLYQGEQKLKNTCAVLFLFVFSVLAAAQTRPKTVTEFYLALPTSFNVVKNLEQSPFRDGFFFNDFYSNERNTSGAEIMKFRKSLIKIQDVQNGYMRLEGTWEGWVEIALFKKADGEYLVALSQVACGPGCQGDVMFLTYKKGVWTNVTKQVFPSSPSSDRGYFKFPRVGTTIDLICGDDGGEDCKDGSKLAEFKWNKTTFVK